MISRTGPGRSRDWLKIKCVHSQEFVILGFTDPAGARTGFGALLLGVYDDDETLRYAGRVGTGFTRQTLDELSSRLKKHRQARSPLSEPLTGISAKGVHWIRPDLVGEVAFTGWTQDGLLRHPAFQGLREDKPARQIRRERTQSVAKTANAKPTQRSRRNSDEESIEIAGVKLSHPNRVLYPEQGITKRELAEYYEKIADRMLPHVSGRPLTLVRCPEGQQGECFYQRNAGAGTAPALRRSPLRAGKSVKNALVLDSLAGLIELVQMGVLEIHTWGSTAKRIERPDQLTFDFDPDPARAVENFAPGARRITRCARGSRLDRLRQDDRRQGGARRRADRADVGLEAGESFFKGCCGQHGRDDDRSFTLRRCRSPSAPAKFLSTTCATHAAPRRSAPIPPGRAPERR